MLLVSAIATAMIASPFSIAPTHAESETPTLPIANPKRDVAAIKAARAAREAARVPRFRKLMGAAETELRNQLAEIVRPLAAIELADADRKTLTTLTSRLKAGEFEAVTADIAAMQDPVARKLAQFMALETGFGTLSEYRDFLTANPLWPFRDRVIRRMEQAAFERGGSVEDLRALFAQLPPQTGLGLSALASAELAVGNTDLARALAGRAWRENGIVNSFETGFLERFASLLKPEDHRARIDLLLAEPLMSRGRRNSRADGVRRMLPLLDEAAQKLTTARLSVYLAQSGADKLLTALSEAQREDPGLLRQMAFRDYRAKRYDNAGKRLAKLPAGTASKAPDADWALRRRVADALVDAKAYALAYDVVKDARPDDINDLKEAAFRAGWIALRHLNEPSKALPHFEAMAQAADGPLSRSRALFWLGRAAEKAGQTEHAAKAYAEAGTFLDTFHGALARVAQTPPQRALTLPLPNLPTDDEIAAFKERDVIKAGVIADKAGLSGRLRRALFGTFTWSVETQTGGEIILAGALAEAIGDTQIAVRAGKAGVARGFPHYFMSYPIHRLPVYEPLRPPPPDALLLSIARQESEFNTRIVSRAGARGVLQVMPITARHVCRNYDIECRVRKLLDDQTYNARIASAYIAEQMAVVDNNMILTLTSYNAGPGRTRQWLRQRGDPRAPGADPLDWVFNIPFDETRLYVIKVLSNMQVYRARLGVTDPVIIDRQLGISFAR
jgi:soluble lytic murein transglycosylase